MPHEGYADPLRTIDPDSTRTYPLLKLIERVTRAIEASDVSSASPVAETTDGVTHGTRRTPTKPNGAQGLGSPDADSGNQPTAQVVDRTNTGKHLEW